MRVAGWLILTFVLMFAAAIAAQLAPQAFGSSWLGVLAGAAIATLGTVGILAVLGKGAKSPEPFPPPRVGGLRGILVGLAIGLAASTASGFLVAIGADLHSADAFWGAITPDRLVGMLTPAMLEEVGMRGGVVHILESRFGYGAGLAGGSLPFGLLHLLGGLWGQPISLAHVIGTSAAGLLLSLTYLRFGLASAIACHWTWNVLAGPWAAALGIGALAFEGAWQTTMVLLVLSLLIHVIRPHTWRDPQQGKQGSQTLR